MASDDYEGPPVFDDDQYEDVIEEEEGFVDNYPNFQKDKTNVSFSGVVLGVEEESMSIYDTNIEDAIEDEEGFIGKRGFGEEEDNMEDVVVMANDLCSSKIQTVSVDFSKTLDSNPHELILLQKGNLVENAEVENEVVKEIEVKPDTQLYDEVKEMVYTHASVCKSTRLYPPIPSEPKITSADNVLPNGSAVKKGTSLLLYMCIKIDDKIGRGVIGCRLDGVPTGAMVGEE
ncbi:integrase, catalytic region, zinc finger, CCHC-type containing protein [Tanacetum coccineum]